MPNLKCQRTADVLLSALFATGMSSDPSHPGLFKVKRRVFHATTLRFSLQCAALLAAHMLCVVRWAWRLLWRLADAVVLLHMA